MLMWDIFGIRARYKAKAAEKERKRLEEMQEKKKAYQERKRIIDDYLNKYKDTLWKKQRNYNDEQEEKADKKNSKCPKCGSTNVINHIKRTKGEIHGSGHSHSTSSSSSFLFSSSSYYSSTHRSKLDGELDTYPVNKCNECGNEWNVAKPDKYDYENVFEAYDSHRPNYLLGRIKEYFELKYDPKDVTDPCNSLEEKQRKFINEYNKYSFTEYKEAPRYMIEYAIYNALHHYSYTMNECAELFECDEDMDEYSYVMPDKIWNIAKQIIGWKG